MQPQQASSIPWGTIIVIVAVLLVLALLVVLIVWLRRRRRDAPARAESGPSLRDRLAHIYKPFYRQMPRSARHYPTVVVLGEAGVGKSHLIDSHVDWRGQANQFQPSRTDQSLLQLYLGPGVIVQEISAPLLRNVSRDAERALSGLWRRLGRRPVTVVVVLDAHRLATEPPQAMAELAQLVRGKLDLISDHGRRPVHIRLCLSRLDRIDGYSEFARLLRRRGHEFRIDTDPARPGQISGSALGSALDPFDGHLSLALTTCTADEFRHVVGFYRGSPALFGSLAPFLHSLRGGDDPFAVEYTIERVCLSAANPDDHVGDPFAVDRTTVAGDIARENRRVYAICGAALGMAVLALIILYGWHGGRVGDANQAVSELATAVGDKDATPQAIAAAQERAHAALQRLDDSEVLWLGSSFEPRKQDVEARYARALRDAYLLPGIDDSAERGRLLYAASLIHAAEDSPLGKLIARNPTPWVDELGVPEGVIRDYVQSSRSPWSGTLPLPDDLDQPAVPKGWIDFLTELERVLRGDRMAPEKLDRLKREVNDELGLSSAERYRSLTEVARTVASDPALRDKLAPLLTVQPASEWVAANYDSLAAVSAMIKQASFAEVPEDVSDWTLQALLVELGRIAPTPKTSQGTGGQGTGGQKPGGQETGSEQAGGQEPGSENGGGKDSGNEQASGQQAAGAGAGDQAGATSAPAVYTFELPDQTVTIAVDDWNRLLKRSSAGLLIDRFMKQTEGSQRSPFFPDNAFYPSVGAVRGTMQGPSVVIPGLYTRRAFDDQVLPVLTAMSNRLPDVLLADGDRSNLETYTLDSINQYATEYGQELDNYYKSFSFGALSLDELIFELQAMSMTSSWFVTFLRAVADTAGLSLPAEGPFFEPMAGSVAPFQSIVAVMTEDKGKFPQLEPYLTIIADLSRTLAAGDDGGGDEEGLDLGPAGNLAMEALAGKDKPLPQVRAWLAASAIEPAYQAPFLAPVERAYKLGYMEIESAVAEAWQSRMLEPIEPLLARFPFNKKAADEVAIADVEEWFVPGKGRFWQAFATYIEPVAVRRGGEWRLRSPLGAPRGMLPLINSVAAMSAALWDEKGNAQPLAIAVTPQPLPTTAVEDRVATLAFLKAGNAAVYAFNQKPQAQTLALEWWAQGTSTVGAQLRAPQQEGSVLRSLDIVDSPWSFYRLLGKARMSRGSAAAWHVPAATPPARQSLTLTFTLNTDPWKVFELSN